MPGRGGEPGLAAAHAEADGEDRLDVERAQVSGSGRNVRLDLLRRDRLDVRPVLEEKLEQRLEHRVAKGILSL